MVFYAQSKRGWSTKGSLYTAECRMGVGLEKGAEEGGVDTVIILSLKDDKTSVYTNIMNACTHICIYMHAPTRNTRTNFNMNFTMP